MKTQLVRSDGTASIQLPVSLIEKAGLGTEVEVLVQGNMVLIGPVRHPREGWAEAATLAHARGDDVLLDPETPTTFDIEEWSW